MILDELVLQNFGVYSGRQSVKLTPQRPGRPIILIGGLNGGGKTTLLDALQLCLYGALAHCSNRNGLAYDQYLARSIHRPVGGEPGREAAVELSFSHASDGEQHHFTLKRSWRVSPSGTRETFEVIRNGEIDRQATEQWAELVEDFIPAAIAPLFFFDGEKIERYAELESAPELIRTAIHNLLGLEIVERLGVDLQVLERRKRTESAAPETAAELAAIASRIEALAAERKALISDRASAANVLDRRALELATLEGQYRREGGTLFEERSELEAKAAKLEANLLESRRRLLALAEDATPLLLVPQLLDDVLHQSEAEERARYLDETATAIRHEHDAVLALSAIQELPVAVRRKIRAALEKRMVERGDQGKIAKLLKLQPHARGLLSPLITEELASLQSRVREGCAVEHDLAQAFQRRMPSRPVRATMLSPQSLRDARWQDRRLRASRPNKWNEQRRSGGSTRSLYSCASASRGSPRVRLASGLRGRM
jgi:DNA sulfur modification protein DndD